MSNSDPRPPSDSGAHTIYGQGSGARRSRSARWIWISVGVVIAALVLWWIYTVTTPAPTAAGGGGRGGSAAGGKSGRGGAGAAGGAGGAPTAVSAAKATQGDMPIYLNELGTVTPTATVTVVPQISGVLQTVAFHEGQMVRKGQPLAQIDPRPYEALLLQAEGTLAKDQAALAEAKVDLKRYELLLKEDSINSQQVDVQRATVLQDQGQVKTDQGSVRTQQVNLIYCHITSPVDGRIGLRQVDPGNYISAGTTTGIVVITVLNPMDVLFTVPEDNLDQVGARVAKGAILPAVAFDRAGTSQLASGTLLTLDNQVDTTTGTVRAKARFNNGGGALFPNQFVNIRLTVDTLKNAIIVPTSAILKGPNGMFVYVAQKTGVMATANVTAVTVGPAAGENTAILSGLQAGDVVITDGSDRLKDGSRVVLPGDCIPARGSAGGAATGQKGGADATKSSGGFLGLFGKKQAQDPLAAMRCKPGQKPESLLGSGGGAFDLNFGSKTAAAPAQAAETGDAAPTPAMESKKTRSSSTTTTSTTTSTPEPAVTPPTPTPVAAGAASGDTGAHGPGGGGRGGGVQAMISALNLDPTQQEKAKAIFDAARQQAESSPDPRTGFRTAFEGAFTKLDAILRPDQRAKLAQLRAEAAARRAQKEASGGGQSDQ